MQNIFLNLSSNFLEENNKISNDWNALNVISENASTVGAFDLGLYKTKMVK